ncbi:MAG TPA: hypothetical protein VGC18_00180 [Lacisediminihabitans sp.]
MSNLQKEPTDPKKASRIRLVLWIAVSGIAIYSIVTGIIGIMHNG